MRVAIVIPARYASSRLPGKPLLRATGKYLVEHVYERACLAQCASDVVVATDDERIRAAVEEFGGRVAMTRADHPSGTDRVAEVAAGSDAEAIVNLQGDEPLFDPAHVDALLRALAVSGTDVSTLAAPIRDAKQYADPNAVKVVCDDAGRALYFSRSPIPHHRDGLQDGVLSHLHIGVYAYRRDVLLKLAVRPPHPLEGAEKLEQLRLLGSGGTIRVAVVPDAHRGVDTPADYAAFVEAYRSAGSG